MATESKKEEAITVRGEQPEKFPMWPTEMDSVFDRMFRGFPYWPRHDSRGHRPYFWRDEWLPSIDVINRGGKILVRADLPGLKREDIDVAVENDMLIVRGHRHEEKEIKEEDYQRSERAVGKFYRAIRLPEGVDGGAIEATYTDGVLGVTVPLPALPEPKKLKVEVK